MIFSSLFILKNYLIKYCYILYNNLCQKINWFFDKCDMRWIFHYIQDDKMCVSVSFRGRESTEESICVIFILDSSLRSEWQAWCETTPQSCYAVQLPSQGAKLSTAFYLSVRRGGPRSGGEVVCVTPKIMTSKSPPTHPNPSKPPFIKGGLQDLQSLEGRLYLFPLDKGGCPKDRGICNSFFAIAQNDNLRSEWQAIFTPKPQNVKSFQS